MVSRNVFLIGFVLFFAVALAMVEKNTEQKRVESGILETLRQHLGRKFDLLDRTKWHALSKKKQDKRETLGFRDINYEIDPKCYPKKMHFYRTYDGSCNWLKKGQTEAGAQNQPFGRDCPAHYKEGTLGEPREGPNPRELSNIFFNNNKTLYWDHTPFLPGFVEFLVHDLMHSASGREKGDVHPIKVPAGDSFFDPEGKGNKELAFWRTKRHPGTGENGKVREFTNGRSNWMDLETLYGTSYQESIKLRIEENGIPRCELILDEEGYLPVNDGRFNTTFKMNGWGKQEDLFVAGDGRANQDFMLLVYYTLFARDHNRLCGIIRKQFPEREEEEIFLTTRTVMSAKMNMAGSAYFRSYFKDLPLKYLPADPLAIYRSWNDQTLLSVNPMQRYPFKALLDKDGNPFVLPNEFSVGYKWHDLIPEIIDLHDDSDNRIGTIDVPKTAFSAKQFKLAGFENVLRGMTKTQIPDFHSGIQNGYRNIKYNFANPNNKDSNVELIHGFDLAAYAIQRERERGSPTFNEYLRQHYDGKVKMEPRKTFEEFTDVTEYREALKRLYKHPDDVDLVVGQQLDQEWWPGLHIPKSMLIFNFYTLFKAAATDRFAANYNVFWCLSEHKPWNCTVNNALQELLWKPTPSKDFPNARWFDAFWMEELDFVNIGDQLLHKMIVRNTNVKCLQKNVFFVPNEKTNPIICHSVSGFPGPQTKWWTRPIFQDNHDFLFIDYKSTRPYFELAKEYGDIVHYRLSRIGEILLVTHPRELKQIFESPIYYRRPPLEYSDYTYGRIAGFKDGRDLPAPSSSYGARTRLMRKLLIKNLDRKGIYAHMSRFSEFSKTLVKTLMAKGTKSEKYYPLYDVRTYYENCGCELTFGKEDCDRDALVTRKMFNGTNAWLDGFADFMIYQKPYDSFLVRKMKAKLDEQMDNMHIFFKQSIERRKSDYSPTFDSLLDEYMFGQIDNKELTADEVYSISSDSMFGAMPGAPFTTVWGMYILSQNPQIVEKLFTELNQQIGNAELDVATIHKLPYLKAFVTELFRHYPGGGALQARASMGQDVMDGKLIVDNTNFFINVLQVHRDPRFWENPDQFDPERWIRKPIEQINPYTFLPFGHGGKGCPGKDVAILQQTIVWADLIRAFERFQFFGEIEKGKTEPEVYMTLFATPKNPLFIKLTPRSNPTLHLS